MGSLGPIPAVQTSCPQVSVRKNVPVIAQEGLEKEDWEAALSIAQGAVMSVWQVVFHQTGMTPKTMTAADARTAGYLVNSTSSRVIFRSPYGMPMSEVLLVSGIPVEVVSHCVLQAEVDAAIGGHFSCLCQEPLCFRWHLPELGHPEAHHPAGPASHQVPG
ncbi:UNVERIFIED_CONTAM: hypothetical protein FKN15_020017 [Acipenser sinensis]